MKDNFIHVCFVIDESGSMSGSVNDVLGGFKKVLDEQKAIEGGQCAISLYKFDNYVHELYTGKNISEVEPLNSTSYSPGGCTAMFDGIGMAIDNIGKWLSGMPEEERPSKNLIVIMTDGEENASHEYSASKVKDMISHQETKYNWTFLYMGTDITTTDYANSIGIKNQLYTTREDYSSNYNVISGLTKSFRCASAATSCATLDLDLEDCIKTANTLYTSKTGLNMDNN